MRSLLVVLALAPAALAADPPSDPLAAAWQDLLSPDEAKAARAVCLLSSKPKEGVAVLAANLRPVTIEPKRIDRLVAELGDAEARAAALVELEYLGKFAKADLERAVKEASNAEVKERLSKLLERIAAYEKQEKAADEKPAPFAGGGRVSVMTINGKVHVSVNGKPVDLTPKVIEKLPPPAAWTRAARAIGVLEFVGTPEAVKVLEVVSLGEDNAPPTKQAQDALARLKRKK